MNRIKFFLLTFVVISNLVLTGSLFANGIKQTKTDHKDLASSYEQKAKEQDAIVAEHTQMKQDFVRRFFINEKISPMYKIREMEKHCDTIIAEASKLRDEFTEFAKWHKMSAQELGE